MMVKQLFYVLKFLNSKTKAEIKAPTKGKSHKKEFDETSIRKCKK
jgi:hypothetical protein